ncbi:MarR family winged helix-turn-helix transcriptional regulator [Flindersiella endophytica]
MNGDDHGRLEGLLNHVVRMIGLQHTWTIGQITISLSECTVVMELLTAGELSQQDLAARLRVDKSRISRIAAQLEARGWLVRERDPDNRRLYRVRLTEDGEHAGRHLHESMHQRHADLLGALSPKERDALRVGLSGLIRVAHEHGHGAAFGLGIGGR